MHGRHYLLSEDMVQVSRTTVATEARAVSTGRTIVFPPVDANDIELVMSKSMEPDAYYIPDGPLLMVGDKIVHMATSGRFGMGTYVTRFDDAFALDYADPDIQGNYGLGTRAEDLFTNQPKKFLISGGIQVNSLTFMQLCAIEDDVVFGHRAVTPNNQNNRGWDEFVALHLDTEAQTARWAQSQRPINTSVELTSSFTRAQTRMVSLGNSHVGWVAEGNDANGWQPTIYMIGYDRDTDTMTPYGPFLFGALSAEGDSHPMDEIFLVRLDANRLLAVWYSGVYLGDSSITTNMASRRPMAAQVLSYDTTAHTITATGPMRVFEAGIEGNPCTLRWFADGEVLVLVSQNYSTIDNLNNNDINYTGPDWHMAARSFKVEGYDVVEGTSHLRIADAPAADPDGDYWYAHVSIGVGDRLAVIWANVDGVTGEGEIRYAKVRVGVSGSERGGMAVYDEGVLIPDDGFQGEIWPHGSVDLDADNTLGFFEQYIDSYAKTAYWFILARRT